MPGSLLNSDPNLSDCSVKSADSRTAKKVSFNNDVRVKQYPWIPEDGNVDTMPSQRFWFKVYKSDTNNTPEFSWKERKVDISNGDIVDSLTPIAEDEDISNGRNAYNFHIQRPTFTKPSSRSSSADPSVDYTDDEPLLRQNKNNNIGGITKAGGCENERIKSKTNLINGINVANKYRDFQRPTISSAAKCVHDPREKMVSNGHATPNSRFQRTADGTSSGRSRSESPMRVNKVKLHDRRLRSNDCEINDEDTQRKVDKAVSTDDLLSDHKEDKLIHNSWWAESRSKDMSTQCNGTLTRFKDIGINCPVERDLRYSAPSGNTAIYKENGYNSRLAKIKADFKPLLVRDKSDADDCVNNVSTKNVREFVSHYSKINVDDRLSKIYESTNGTRLMSDADDTDCTKLLLPKTSKPRNIKVKPFPWEKSKYGKMTNNSDKLYNGSSSLIVDLDHRPTDYMIPKIMSKTLSIPNISERREYDMSRSRNSSPFRSGRRSASCDRTSRRTENGQSAIDWSQSGFQLGNRLDKSYSSDSECVVHHQPPLLMYIPGVSHHNRPAIEDDRLSAFSEITRLEAEDDGQFLSDNSTFMRRHSMPRNGKLNWLRWKSSKKNFQR